MLTFDRHNLLTTIRGTILKQRERVDKTYDRRIADGFVLISEGILSNIEADINRLWPPCPACDGGMVRKNESWDVCDKCKGSGID